MLISTRKHIEVLNPFFLANEMASTDFRFNFSAAISIVLFSFLEAGSILFGFLLTPDEENHEHKNRNIKNPSKALVLAIKKWLSLNGMLNQRKFTKGIFESMLKKL